MSNIENIFNKNVCENLPKKYLFLLYFIAVLFINVFPFCVDKPHVLHRTYVRIFNHPFDCWALSHLLFYIILGFLFPHYWKLILLLSVVWELIEYIGYHVEKYVLDNKNIYWCAKFSDIIVNLIGFIIGLSIRIIITYFI